MASLQVPAACLLMFEVFAGYSSRHAFVTGHWPLAFFFRRRRPPEQVTHACGPAAWPVTPSSLTGQGFLSGEDASASPASPA